ncbi:MAG: alanine--tRNA ligase, partial [Rhodocyclaceae bacterium]|nr:alanine--tRNA ligase [Rhodocyclaceae bacterium]
MKSAEIREKFLRFFESKGHQIVASSSLVPFDDPTLLFTNAGMNQFKDVFLGFDKRPYQRATTAQKCVRAGGKHNDLENVGYTARHHTFFEMLGNFSFGDYFKHDAINYAWELLTEVYKLPADKLWVTVYAEDDEAYDIWTKEIGVPVGRVVRIGDNKGARYASDNFWMMGDTGPCGPCSEIHFNLLPSDDEAAGRANVNSSSPRCIEIWNHVFIQFNANADGTFAPLAAKHVDTGMGFERVAGIHATTDGFKDFTAEPSNYNADVFKPTFDKLEGLSGKTYAKTVPAKRDGLTEQEQIDIAFRVLADHARCVTCAIADGILPGNEGRNYVIRRILRRGIMYGQKSLGLKTGDFSALVGPVVESLGTVFPELNTQRVMIERAIRAEEESFGRSLERGLQNFNKAAAAGAITGAEAFELYDTFGF